MNNDLKIAKDIVETEIQALKKLHLSFTNESNFTKAVNLITKLKSKCIVVGVGKSFLVGQKIAATLSSLGTPSFACSANDLSHGGLGVIQKSYDILLILSVSGESSELNNILSYANKYKIPTIGVSCKASSMLLRYSNVKILLPRVNEAGQTLAPTSSSLNFLAWGDALAIACMKRKKWTKKKFISTHPSGTLSTALVQVKDIMVTGNNIPLISAYKSMREAVNQMTKKKLGMVCCKEKSGKITILTDGDLRRNSNNLYKKKILKVCSKNPAWIADTATALSAIEKMNSLEISSLLVAEKKI